MHKAVHTLEQFRDEAKAFAAQLSPQESSATLITLSGELGAGKTTFVKTVADTLGVEDEVTSPTFVLEKIYVLPAGGAFSRLVHIDAYRLEGGAELSPLRMDELMQDPTNLILLEWPEKVADALPSVTLPIKILARKDGGRMIMYG